MNELIAVVDDDPDILELVSLHLKKAMFKVKEFSNAEKFLTFIETNLPDTIILDVMLPDADGMELCKNLKQKPRFVSVPVIMLTARGSETDKVIGLELGADDYVTKPFSPRELVARVKAVLRRRQSGENHINIRKLLKIDTDKHEVFATNNKIELTLTEFKILAMLAQKPGWVFSREKIIELYGETKNL